MEINTLIDTYRAQWLLLVSPACRVSAHESEYLGSNTATEGSGTDEIFYNLVRGLLLEILATYIAPPCPFPWRDHSIVTFLILNK